MGIQTTIRVTCDYSECKAGQNGPAVVEWVSEEIKAGKPAPHKAAEVISFDLNGTKVAFCGLLHTAKFFLPPGYEIVAKKVIEFPDNGNFPELEAV